MAAYLSLFTGNFVPNKKLLMDPEKIKEQARDPRAFERYNEIKGKRAVDEHDVVHYEDPQLQLAWTVWQMSAMVWAEQVHALYKMMALTQAMLLEDGAAFACNLKGSKQTTGAVYSHLVAQRDALAEQLALAKAQGFVVEEEA